MQHPMQYYTPTHCMEGQNGTYTPHRGSSYHGDTRLRYMDDETIGGNTNWVLGDLRSLHRCVPALRRTGIDVAGMRAHFYPEGGWGWLVCAAGFLALLLTTGMQLAFGLLHLYAVRHLGEVHLMDIGYEGVICRSTSVRLLHCDSTESEGNPRTLAESQDISGAGGIFQSAARTSRCPRAASHESLAKVRLTSWHAMACLPPVACGSPLLSLYVEIAVKRLFYLSRTYLKCNVIVWAGALSAAISRGSAPLVVGACRRGNTRLTAVIGGLVLALASLFTSFAVQMHQVLLSYGLVLGTGAGLVRETASLVLGNYFRKRREFVEMVVQAGTGVGIVLFSVVYKEALGKLGWRPGLQSVTGALSLAFFLGLIYRSASLYHPQRRAILHLKNQRSKVKEKKSSTKIPRQPLVDLSPLGSRPVRMLMLAAGAAGFGLYTPAFYITGIVIPGVIVRVIVAIRIARSFRRSLNEKHHFQALQGYQDGLEASALVLLQTFLGLAAALGCAALGVVIVRPSAQCLVSRQYLCQAALIGVAVAQVALGSVQGYHGLVLASALYGASLGGTLYSLKMLALERLRARHFARSWALVQAAEALPILLGVPLTGYMNASSPRVGYYACTLSSLCGAALLFLVGWGRQPASPVLPGPRLSSLGIVPPPPPCACPPPPRPRLPKSQSLHVPLDVEDGMREREFVERVHHDHHHPIVDHYCHPQFHTPLRPSKSVPEGLGHQDPYRTRPRRHRDITVIEQITTSV
ncbi:Monocarboxylate transporter 14 [Trachymyrmex cornetzi]|uniref:Monocarboxylate transporter 14 n=1 Tax=Trachymyrmex cornetzi TaxID=471704 RepID=A0A195DHY3_9HYME|nr:Monocarboxylate transporter 14 [Trachymyrmex cornetzi]